MRLKRLPLVSVRQPCDVSWDGMTGDDVSRRCAECDRLVHNLSALTAKEAEGLLKEPHGRLCITYQRGPNGQLVTQDRPARFSFQTLAGSAAVVAVALSASSAGAAPQSTPPSSRQDSAVASSSHSAWGGLHGRIRLDVLGDPVENTTITAIDSNTGREFTSRSLRDGTYRLSLPKGRYDVSISAPGFPRCDVKGVDIGGRLITADVNVSFPPLGEYVGFDACGNRKLDRLRHKK